MKKYNYLTDQYEDDGQPNFMDAVMAGLPQPKQAAPAPQPQMNPVVKDYLMKKLKPTDEINEEDESDLEADPSLPAPSKAPNVLDQFSPEKYQQALQQMKDKQSQTALAQFASGIGDALARRDQSGTDSYFQNLRNNIKDQTVGEFERQKSGAVSDLKTKQQLNALDPNSQESQNFRKLVQSTMPNIAKTYGDNFDLITAADAPNILDFGKMREQIDARKEQASIMRENKTSDKQNQAYNQTTALLEQMRGSPAASQAEKDLYAVQKVNSLVNLYGDPNKLNPAQVQLLATEVAKIASGGVPSIHELQGLNPATIPSSLASLAQKVMNKPKSAQAGEFVKAMQDYTNSLARDAQAVIKDRYGRIIEGRKSQFSPGQQQTLTDQYINRFKDVERPATQNSKPKTVVQDGHTYTLNEQTGEYE